MMAECSVDGCVNTTICRGWCSMHYQRWQAHGDPSIRKRVGSGELKKWIESNADYSGEDCLIWPFSTRPDGRAISILADGKRHIAHRYMCILKNGPPPSPNHQAAHSCGNGHLACINPHHLRWATNTENQADRAIHGTSNIGVRNPSAKINPEIASIIRSLKGIELQRVTAARYGVTRAHVAGIQSGRFWNGGK